jgi:hypothetical protein
MKTIQRIKILLLVAWLIQYISRLCIVTLQRIIWDKPQNVYEGDAKVKGAKLQTYRGQFEQLKMKEDEDITAYFL